ncbi:MAG: glycerol-3-phosphate 1-O-acyltransferase PlsY [Deltaproteobacteria bacterium]
MIIKYIVTIIIGYLIGSISSAIIVARLVKNVDIRTMGSGNAGATNVLRTLGKGPAALVLVGDALKGVIAVLIGQLIFGNQLGAVLGGFLAVVGHNWPIFFDFKGGKGILTSASVILMITPKIGLVVVLFAILVIALTRYVSLGSMSGAILYPVIVIVMDGKTTSLVVFSILIALLAIYRHKNNIKRLKDGTETKIGEKRTDMYNA